MRTSVINETAEKVFKSIELIQSNLSQNLGIVFTDDIFNSSYSLKKKAVAGDLIRIQRLRYGIKFQ